MLKALPHKKTNLVILPASDASIVRSGRNIPGVKIMRADSLNTYEVVGHQQIIVLQEALPVIEKTYSR
jgi:large subunit ribosomal protein L4